MLLEALPNPGCAAVGLGESDNSGRRKCHDRNADGGSGSMSRSTLAAATAITQQATAAKVATTAPVSGRMNAAARMASTMAAAAVSGSNTSTCATGRGITPARNCAAAPAWMNTEGVNGSSCVGRRPPSSGAEPR
jgi:hypothetical protein